MAEHTKLPWRVEQHTDLIWGACDPDDSSTFGMGYSIVEGKTSHWGKRIPSMDEREANAAFIVKAVNSHDALVKAIQEACDLLAERAYGNAARSPGHNARIRLEGALASTLCEQHEKTGEA